MRPDGVRWARLFDQAWCNWIDLEYNWPHFELVDPKLIWNGTSIAIWVRWTWIYLGCPDAKCGPLISMLACKIIKQLSLLIIGGLAAFRQSIQVHTNSLSFPPPNHNLNSTKMAKHEVIKLPFTSPPPPWSIWHYPLPFYFDQIKWPRELEGNVLHILATISNMSGNFLFIAAVKWKMG